MEGIKHRMDEAEDQISKLEDKVERNTQVEQLHKKELKNYEDSSRELQENIKGNNISILGIPEGEEKEEGRETLFEKIMTENFLNLERGKTMHFRTTEGPNQDEPKEAYSKTHHNENAKF